MEQEMFSIAFDLWLRENRAKRQLGNWIFFNACSWEYEYLGWYTASGHEIH